LAIRVGSGRRSSGPDPVSDREFRGIDAYHECFRRGFRHEEFYVGKLKAEPDGIPPWGPFEGDWTFHEATEEIPGDDA
jgi:hypothetical protein